MRTRPVVFLAALALLCVGCTPSPSSSTTENTPTPTTTTTTTTEPTRPDEPDDGLTREVLIQLCLDKTRDYYAEVQFFPEDARVERRKVDPPWLVIVPSRTVEAEGVFVELDGASVCTVGGTASEPVFEVHAAQHMPTEQEVQDSIDGVEYYEGD